LMYDAFENSQGNIPKKLQSIWHWFKDSHLWYLNCFRNQQSSWFYLHWIDLHMKGKRGWRVRVTGDEFDQSTLYTHMEVLQWNPLVQLIYVNKNKKEKRKQ
jgi:hypothetical protein